MDNPAPDMQFFNSGDSPVFDNPADALKHMSEQEEAARLELQEEAERLMDEASQDPSLQQYFMNLDTKTVVKSEKEYQLCLKNHVPMKVIPYGYALHLLKEEDARKRQKLKNKKRRKAARASRKRNRL
jgi:hypothetical protein